MFLKNKNIIFKMRRSKVTDYAALSAEIWRFGYSETLVMSDLNQNIRKTSQVMLGEF